MAVIYGLECKPAMKVYVGCTSDSRKRFREHRCLLRKGKHASPSLQAAWDKYGEGGFSIREIETLSKDASIAHKRQRELWWMKWYLRFDALFNEKLISFQGPDGSLGKAQKAAHRKSGNRWTPEANLKRSLAQKGKPKGHGAKISATKRAKSMMR